MNSKEIHVGGVYKVKDAEGEIRTGKVLTASASGVKVAFGKYDEKTKTFSARTIIKGDVRIKDATIPFTSFQQVIDKGVSTKMATKKKEEVEPLLKPSQKGKGGDKGTARESAASGKQEKADKIKTDRKTAASQKKTKTEEQKAAEKAQKNVVKLAGKIRTALTDTDLKEKDVAGTFSTGRKDANGADQPTVAKFEKLTEDEATKALDFVKEKSKEAKKAKALAKKSELTDEEIETRKQMERQVRKNLENFQNAAMEVGSALAVINEQRLYRSTHERFNDYVLETYDLSPAQAYSVISAATTFKMIIGDDVELNAKNLPSIRAAEAIQRSTNRLLADNGYKGQDDEKFVTTTLARNLYNLAVQTAPTDKNGKAILSPAHLDSVSMVMNDIAKTGAVEIDGKQVPLNVARAAIGEQIAEQSAERQKRLNQYLADTITAKRDEFKQAFDTKNARAGTGRLDTAINNATGVIGDIPEGVTPKLTLNCSVHGRSGLDPEMNEQILRLTCGCEFLMTTEGLAFSQYVKPTEPEPQAEPQADTASAS